VVERGWASGRRASSLARDLDGAGILGFTQGNYSRAEAFITEFLALD
jgi:hypothetical protein